VTYASHELARALRKPTLTWRTPLRLFKTLPASAFLSPPTVPPQKAKATFIL